MYDYSDKYLWDLPIQGEEGFVIKGKEIENKKESLREILLRKDPLYGNLDPNIDYERIISSPLGERIAQNMVPQIFYADEMGEDRLNYLKKHGIIKKMHRQEEKTERYAVYLPVDASRPENAGEKYPLVFVLPGGYKKGRSSIASLEGRSGFVQLASREKFIVVMPQNSDMENIIGVLKEVEKEYPVDRRRVYCTGYSQGGRHTSGVTIAYRKYFAAALSGGNHCFALPDCRPVTEEEIEASRYVDLPLILMAGQFEAGHIFPFYKTYFTHAPDVIDKKISVPQNSVMKVAALNLRLWTQRCRQVTYEQCKDTEHSGDEVERIIGAPFDKTEIKTVLGFKHYIGDILNEDGNDYLRIVCYENMPHMWSPTIAEMSWEFMKRFGRDTDSGKLLLLDE